MRTAAILVGSALTLCACGWTGFPDREILADDMRLTFLDLDRDRNGSISRSEARAVPLLERRFARADADGDGVLDRYEFNAPGWRPYRSEPD